MDFFYLVISYHSIYEQVIGTLYEAGVVYTSERRYLFTADFKFFLLDLCVSADRCVRVPLFMIFARVLCSYLDTQQCVWIPDET